MEQKENHERRSFLKKASIGGLVTLLSPQLILASSTEKSAAITLSKDDVILFQGDSITDAGRKRDNAEMNNSAALGSGYAFVAAAALLNKYADKNLKIYNRGVSGNKVFQLADRWDKDCLELKPTVLSILIGVNDYWHKHDGKYDGTVKVYKDDFRKLLDRTKKQLPDVKLIISEPFAVKGVKAVNETWYPEFNDYRYAARDLAKEFNAAWVPYQQVFDDAQKTAPGSYWTADGVHPSVAGAALMAKAWLEVVK